MPNEIDNNLELQQVLWACYEYWQGEPRPPHERSNCYSWVVKPYEKKFGTRFHQSRMRKLADLGFLQFDEDTSRGGGRRYYKVVDPDGVAKLLKKWYEE